MTKRCGPRSNNRPGVRDSGSEHASTEVGAVFTIVKRYFFDKAGGLSFAGAFCAATALRYNAIVLTGDPEFHSVENLIDIHWI